MADESKIMKMMEEMETHFKERDRLFQEMEEAYRKRYDDLIRRESAVKERERSLQRSWMDHEARISLLNDKEEEIRLKDEELKKEISLREEEYARMKEKMKEDQLRLNILETRLQNESLKQDADRLNYRAEKADDGKFRVSILPYLMEAELEEEPYYRTLKEENRKLSDEILRLYDELISEKELTEALEEEKQDLFKALLESDPDTARLFEVGEKDETDGNGDPESLTEGRQDLPEPSAGERSTE